MADRKRPLIISAAHLEVCKCKKHGRIVYSNGDKSIEVCSVEAAMTLAEEGIAEGKIIPEELPELRRQISKSGFPYHINANDLICATSTLLDDLEKEQSEEPFGHIPPESLN